MTDRASGRWAAFVAVLLLAATGLFTVGDRAVASPTQRSAPRSQDVSAHAMAVPDSLAGHRRTSVCQHRAARQVSCLAIRDVTVGTRVSPDAAAGPSGYWPSDLQDAYSLPTGNGADVTVAVVAAYDAPNVQSDMDAYRQRFGLPRCGPGCFTKVNQRGRTSPLPPVDPGWAEEITLDVEMVSAACPRCAIVLVEADDSGIDSIDAAEDTAAAFHPEAISNSFGGDEYREEVADDPHFNHPGIAVTVSAGDSGYGVQYPAASPYVIAVGGTSLWPAGGTVRGFQESVWGNRSDQDYGAGTGSGCSRFEPKPSWQADTGCPNRSVADLSAVADPATGVAAYQTSSPSCARNGGWCVFGGTSAAAPLVAGMYGLAAGASAPNYPAEALYDYPQGLLDVVTGSNSQSTQRDCPTGSYFCNAYAGYDGPTGLGSPNGIAALRPRSTTGGAFTPVPPRRILDTRSGLGRGTAAPLAAGTDWTVRLAGAAGVPLDATAVVLNVTVTEPTDGGYLTVHPADSGPPLSSNLNFAAGQTVPNQVMVSLADGAFRLYDFQVRPGASTHVVVDVSGYYTGSATTAGTFSPLAKPDRLLDTRTGTGAPARPVNAGEIVRLPVAGRGGLPGSGVGAVVLNLTVTQPTAGGYLTAYADDPVNQPAPPTASNLNFVADQTVPNLAVVPVGPDGRVDLYDFQARGASVHLVADVFGYFLSGSPTAAGALHTMPPTRLLDTRSGRGARAAAVTAGQTVRLKVTGGLVPSGISGVVLNVTVTEPTAGGYITAFPDGQGLPTASNLNYIAGQTVPNLVVVPVSADGYLNLYNFEVNSGTVHLVADISGYFYGRS